MKILALETCTQACSVALLADKNSLHRSTLAANQHSQVLLNMINEILAESELGLGQLDAISFSRGPGSFTGVRIGTAVAQGLAFAQDLALVPLSSLAVLAQQAVDTLGATHIIPVLDARMGEVYWAAYEKQDNGLLREVVAEQVSSPDLPGLPEKGKWWIVGTGVNLCAAVFSSDFGLESVAYQGQLFPRAVDMLPLAKLALQAGQLVPPEKVQAVYLRNNVALKSIKNKVN